MKKLTPDDTLSEIEERWKTKFLELKEADVSAGDPPKQKDRKGSFDLKIHCPIEMSPETARGIVVTLRRVAKAIQKGWAKRKI